MSVTLGNPLGGVASPRRLLTRFGGFLVLAALVVLAIESLPGLGDVRQRLSGADASGIALIAALELASLLGFVAALRGAFSSIPSWRVSVELGTAEQAANVLLPAGGVGGLALGALIAQDAGVPSRVAVSRTVALFLVTSAVTFVAIGVGGLIAVGDVSWWGSILPAIAAWAVVALVGNLPRVLPQGNGRLRRRVSTETREGVSAALALVREPNIALLVGAVAYFACDVAALAAAFEAIGADVPPLGTFVLAYALGQAGGMLPLPGGIGGVDGGLIGMLVLYGAALQDATAAVLAYRLFQLGLPTVLGLAGTIALAHRHRTRRDPAAVAARFEGLLGHADKGAPQAPKPSA